MKELKLSEIEITNKVSEFRLSQKQNAIYLLESLNSNNLLFQDFNKDEKNGANKIIRWYFEL